MRNTRNRSGENIRRPFRTQSFAEVKRGKSFSRWVGVRIVKCWGW